MQGGPGLLPSPHSHTHRAPAADGHPAEAASQRLLPGACVLGAPTRPARKDQAGKALLLGAVVREEPAGWFWVLREWRLSDVLVSTSVPANLRWQGRFLHSQKPPVGAEEGHILRGHQGPMGEVEAAERLSAPGTAGLYVGQGLWDILLQEALGARDPGLRFTALLE